jgi:hypothetical protein
VVVQEGFELKQFWTLRALEALPTVVNGLPVLKHVVGAGEDQLTDRARALHLPHPASLHAQRKITSGK